MSNAGTEDRPIKTVDTTEIESIDKGEDSGGTNGAEEQSQLIRMIQANAKAISDMQKTIRAVDANVKVIRSSQQEMNQLISVLNECIGGDECPGRRLVVSKLAESREAHSQ